MLSDRVSKLSLGVRQKGEELTCLGICLIPSPSSIVPPKCDSCAHHTAACLVLVLLIVPTHPIRILLVRVLLIWTILLLIHSSDSNWHTTSTNPAAIALHMT